LHTRIVLAGRRITTAGTRIVVAGRRIVVTGRRILTAGTRIVVTGRRIATAGTKIVVTGRRIRTAGTRIVVAGRRILFQCLLFPCVCGSLEWLRSQRLRRAITIVFWVLRLICSSRSEVIFKIL
jgi:hypothetical protein